MARFSQTGMSLGASELSAIVLGHDGFQTAEDVRLRHLNVINGGSDLDDRRFFKARQRGNYMEGAIGRFADDQIREEIRIVHGDEAANEFSVNVPTSGASIEDADKFVLSLDFIARHGSTQDSYPIYLPSNPLIADSASICVQGIYPIECKTSAYNSEPSESNIIQANAQAKSLGANCFVIAMLNQNMHLNLFPFEFSADLWNACAIHIHNFWDIHIKDNVPYDTGKPKHAAKELPNDDEVGKFLYELMTNYRIAGSEILKWKKTQAEVRKALEESIDSMGKDVDCIKVDDLMLEYPVCDAISSERQIQQLHDRWKKATEKPPLARPIHRNRFSVKMVKEDLS